MMSKLPHVPGREVGTNERGRVRCVAARVGARDAAGPAGHHRLGGVASKATAAEEVRGVATAWHRVLELPAVAADRT